MSNEKGVMPPHEVTMPQVSPAPPVPSKPKPPRAVLQIREDQTQVAVYINEDGTIERTEFGKTQWKRDLRTLLIALAALAFLLFAIVSNVLGAEAKSIVILDGDTVRADLHLGFDVVLRDQTIRIHDFDAWEATRRRQTVRIDDEELLKGAKAKEALAKLLHEAKRVAVVESGKGRSRDVYGRWLAIVYVDGRSVADLMRAGGHERK